MTSDNRFAVLAVLASALFACKGSVDATPPVANAGVDQTAWKGALVTLNGKASSNPGGGALTFAWRQAAGPAVPLSDDRAARPSFLAPRVTTTLRFVLEVSDGKTSATDEVIVAIGNRAPRAVAGADQVGATGHVLTLDAGASTDPDGDPLTASWFERSGPPVTLVAHPDGSASFVAPATPAVLEFALVVSDGEATSPEDVVRVQVLDESANWPPVANAGPDREVARRSVVVLAGYAVDRELDRSPGRGFRPRARRWRCSARTDPRLRSWRRPPRRPGIPARGGGCARHRVGPRRRAGPQPGAGDHLPDAVAQLAGDGGSLVAHAVVSDPDLDPLTSTWEWRRNGTVLAGETGATLAASLTARGDVFLVKLTASDGSREAVAQASVTIQDSPAIVTVSAPATAPWGEPLPSPRP